MEITPGITHTATATVTGENTARRMGSGSLEVFATPMMIALMEQAACLCLEALLPPEQTSVGTAIAVEHVAATPLGGEIAATAEITAVDRRRVEFKVTARDGAGEIGSGNHTRFIVEGEKFTRKAQGRLEQKEE